MSFTVNSDRVTTTDDEILARYDYHTTHVEKAADGRYTVTPVSHQYTFKTDKRVPKTGVMFVGWGGNNGSTVTGGIIANRENITWRTKEKVHTPDYFGSLSQASTVRLGNTASGEEVHIPFKDMLPMVAPNDLVIGGWDINGANLAQAMERAQVLNYDLQRQLVPHLEKLTPLPSIYYPDFIASNQEDRADHVIPGDHASQEHVDRIRGDIQKFKADNGLDTVIVLWTANTERFAEVAEGIHDTADNLLKAIADGNTEVAPSQIFAVASILEGCAYINGSPQNTFVPGVIDLSERENVFIGGDDFKSGQTKIKSVLVDFLVGAGIKPESIVSYNHLGNNDGKNLSSQKQFRSKEISKSNVVDDMVNSNRILYREGEHPDHCVVIKYVPHVADSKRAMDEYTSSIFLGGKNTIVMHNTCEDSLLAAPLIIDLVVFTELLQRIKYKTQATPDFESLSPILSVLSYLLKAPMVPKGTPVVNALMAQRACLINLLRACSGLPPQNDMLLEHKTKCPPLTLSTDQKIESVLPVATPSATVTGA